MLGTEVVAVGIVLAVVGAGFLLMARTLAALASMGGGKEAALALPAQPLQAPEEESAGVIVVASGGRVVYLNRVVREWLDLLPEDRPSLEFLLHRVRPDDEFMRLCSQPGEARLNLAARALEALSYAVPYKGELAMAIVLRPLSVSATGEEGGGNSPVAEMVRRFVVLGQKIATHLDFEEALLAVAEMLAEILPFDVMEITLWDKRHERLVPYRYAIEEGKVLRHPATERYAPEESLSGYVLRQRQPVLVADLDHEAPVTAAINRRRYPIRAYLGVPLVVNEKPIGTLEIASFTPGAYTVADQNFFALAAVDIAVAVYNARRFSETSRQLQELRNLAEMARAVGGVKEARQLVAHIMRNISALLSAQVMGFLFYDEVHHVLQAQWPFKGLPEGFVEAYRTRIPSGGRAEALLLQGEPLVTDDAVTDERWQVLGLAELSKVAGIHHSVLYPLNTGQRSLGFLQVANKPEDAPFDTDDLEVLRLIVGQVVPLLENAVLFEEARQRAQRAEALRRIASLAASEATLEELFKFSLVEMARLVGARYGAVLLWEEEGLVPHETSVYGLSPEQARAVGVIRADAPDFLLTVSRTGRPFLSRDVQNDRRVARAYRPILKTLPDVRAALVVPMQAHGEKVGEILLGSDRPGQFDRSDLQLIAAAAAQLAVGVERQRLLAQSDETLRSQVRELSTLTRLSRELAAVSSLEELLRYAHRQVVELTAADCGHTLVLEASEEGKWHVLHQAGGPCRARLHPLDEHALAQGVPVDVSDYRTSSYTAPHEGVRSSLVLPLLYQNEIVGVLHLHAHQPNHFDYTRRRFAHMLAQHIAVAIGHAREMRRLFDHNRALQHKARGLQRLQDFLQTLHPLAEEDEIFERFVALISDTAGFDAVLLARYDVASGRLNPVAVRGFTEVAPLPWDALNLLLEDRFGQGEVYFIPAEERPPLPANLHLPAANTSLPADVDETTWRPEDLLLVALRMPEGELLGVVYLDAPREGRRPDEATLEVLRLLGAEGAWLLEVRHLLEGWGAERRYLEDRVREAEEVTRQVQRDLPRWLRKDLQQAIDRYTLAQRAERLRVSLEVTTVLNRQPSRSGVLNALGRQLVERLGFNYVLIAEPTPFRGDGEEGGVRLFRVFGELPPGSRLDMLLGQRNPLTEVLREGKVLIVPDIGRDRSWERSPLLQRLQAQSFVAFPIVVEQQGEGGRPRGAVHHLVLATSSAPMASSSHADALVFELLGRQVGIVLQNLELLANTSRRLRVADLLLSFSSQLGVLDPGRILNTLLESALGVLQQHAHAGFVALWDPEQEMLRLQAAGGYAAPDEMLKVALSADSLPARVMFEGQPRRIGELDFAAAYPLDAEGLLAYQKATAERIPVSTMIVPLGSGKQALGVVVLDNFNTTAAFTREDQDLIVSLARQTALSLENARLLQTAERRAAQLHALAAASADIVARSLSLEEIESSLLEQLAQVLPYDGGTLWLREGKNLRVRDARGFPNADELVGITIAIEDSRLFQDMLAARRALVVHDTHADNRFPSPEVVPNRSWLGVPLRFKDEVLGVIALEKKEPHFFTRDWVETAETFASQAAAALANARLYEESLHRSEELDRRSRRLALVYEVTAELSSSLDPHYIATYTARRLHEALGAVPVSLVLWQEEQPILVAEAPSVSETGGLPRVLPAAPLFAHLKETLGIFRTEDYAEEPLMAPLLDFLAAREGHEVVAVPLTAGETFFGVVFLHVPAGRDVGSEEIDLAQTVAKQAAVALQNAHLYETTRRFSEELEARVNARTRELQREHHRAQTLLRIMGELSASLDLDQVLNRTLDLLNEALSAEQSSILLARSGESTLFFRAGRGYTEQPPVGGRPTDISAKDSLAGWVIQNNQPVLIADLRQDPRWSEKPHGLPTAHRSVLGVPLVVAQETLGALLLFHPEPHHFTDYHLDLAEATAKQVAVAINNAELFRLIREQAERLGKLLRQQEVEASRARAILDAIADGVLVTDAKGKITLFNPSAERLLGLSADQVVGQPLEHFVGFFGSAGRQWMETIHTWSEEVEAEGNEPTTYAEQLELDDGRVVSVHLAPVFFRREFLGTVSVFRDITHQIEVDRLKSEFVATVSHELRTPMTAIKGYVDILLMGAAGPLTDQQRRFLKTVQSNTERLNLLVGDLLDISRIEAGRIALVMEALNLKELLEDVVNEQRRLAEEAGREIVVEVAVPEDLPLVRGDHERVRQIVENLIENAYRYTPDGGRVRVTAMTKDGEVQVDVSDTGIGISPEEQQRVFERFYRGENPLVMASAGTGLGLAIVKTLVEMHGGRIWVESSGVPGEGSTFSFTLPVYTEEDEQHSAAGEA